MKKLKSPIIYQTDYDLKTASQLDERIKQYYFDVIEKNIAIMCIFIYNIKANCKVR